jgi:hypothetical protein
MTISCGVSLLWVSYIYMFNWLTLSYVLRWWYMYAQVMNSGGNLIDAISLAVRTALLDTK